MPLITLTTDFGTQDAYVACMKGVIYGIQPQAMIVDITHEIRPQHIRDAAFVLVTAVDYFPAGTVHVVVVDPGVGSARRAIIAQTGDAYFVAPDNGVLSLVLQSAPDALLYEITNPAYQLPHISNTFHGRDIFAPVGAHLASGVSPDIIGEPIDDLVTFLPHLPQYQGNQLIGEIIYIDHFGNCISNIQADQLDPDPCYRVIIDGQLLELYDTYAAVNSLQPLALIGSSGYLEIAVRDGNASKILSLSLGAKVALKPVNCTS
ncbi:MAG: hypothetical protein D6675_10245 [Gemmatimonadetes bacterium]|nr:MAG: hypothetical protein D6675_10245 [Gemmatimonadota bacterium]